MNSNSRRWTHRVATAAIVALAATASLVVPATTAAPAWAASYAKPSGLKAAKVSANSIALTWTAVRKAPAYRVQFSTKSNMSSPKTMDVVGNYLEWSRLDPDATTSSPRLAPGKTYYFRVKVIGLNKASLSGYSKALKAKTASAKSYAELAPVRLKTTARSTSSVYASWSSRGPGVSYKVIYGTNSKLPYSSSRVITTPNAFAVIEGLTPGKKYFYKVKVIDAATAEISPYSSVRTLSSPTTSVAPPIKVATYNLCSWVSSCGGNWTTRMPAIVANLTAQAPDIAALQEISTSRPLSGFLDAWNLASGRHYITTDSPNRTVSNSTRLVYDSDRLTMVDHGVLALTAVEGDPKYAVWAILQDTRDGRQLFAVSTHLSVGNQHYELRQTQTQQIVDLIAEKNPSGLPVVVAGDFNSGKAYQPSNTIYDVMRAAGYRDPLGNTNNSWAVDGSATAEHRVDLEYNTFNGFDARARVAKYSNGFDIDYIWHNAAVRVAVSQVVVELDTAGNFVGTIPSDHNMLVAVIHLKS